MSRSRRAAAAAALAAAALSLAACAPAASPSATPEAGGAEQSITAFVEALSDGRLGDAVGMTTASASDFACSSMVAGDGAMAMAAPEVGAVEEQGDRATAEVSYSSPAEQTERFELVREGERWLVEIPDSFRIEIGFDAPVVAELVIDEDCRVPVQDSQATVLAWPGTYRVDVVDPTSVLERTEQLLYGVPASPVTDGSADPSSLPAVPEGVLSVLRADASSLLVRAWDTCSAAGLTGPECPAALAGATPASGAEPTGEWMIVDRVWTDDGRQWRFETRPGALEAVKDGQSGPVEFRYSGTLSRDTAGELVASFS